MIFVKHRLQNNVLYIPGICNVHCISQIHGTKWRLEHMIVSDGLVHCWKTQPAFLFDYDFHISFYVHSTQKCFLFVKGWFCWFFIPKKCKHIFSFIFSILFFYFKVLLFFEYCWKHCFRTNNQTSSKRMI